MFSKASAALGFLVLASRVAAHGVLTSITVGGKEFAGVEPSSPADTVSVEWHAFGATDHGFVDPTRYSSPDIICHKQAKTGQTHATAAAGSIVEIQWDTWPESHKGPVIDYIADCGGPCEAVTNPTTLKWSKIDEAGFLKADGSQTGVWASDKLIAQGFKWPVTIPANLKAGNYVLRHEIIALHSANAKDQAQNYPLCVNLEITGGGGSALPAGVPGTALYKNTDPGIFFNIYTTPTTNTYPIPGPPLPADFGGSSSGASAATTSPTSQPPVPSTFATSTLRSPTASASLPAAAPASAPGSCLDTAGLTPEMQRVLGELVVAMRAAGKGPGKRGVRARELAVRRGWGLVGELER